ncbi:MAG TPA: carboxypeptidase regulatory-like domain-containing protein [Terriglobia bacterium]|nr:carboxypeptidase regulatory-like domain-containing protein [Terriglobia bacterium]
MKHQIRLSLLVALLSLPVPYASVWAQSTAQISGSVTDRSSAVLPGVEVTVTQTDTGLVRSVVSNETGSYTMTNLPVGRYRLEATLPGFRTYAQTGIILQVGGNPTVNIVLEVGQLSETVEVQADAALVETRSTGVGQVIDNLRVTELPLGGRQLTELIILSGAAVGGGTQNSPRNYPTDIISVGGGSNDGLAFMLDGGVHNDPYGNQSLPLPFPDAIQEFKVETSAVPAQYGFHAAGAVNVVTKSGTNQYHGSLFEFVRNKIFNAQNPFATEKNGLKKNQFGGVLGGPIVNNKLFFFGGYQVTLERSVPTALLAFVPTPQMLAGDWTTFASAQCQGAGALALRTPFANNRVDPGQYSPAAVIMATKYLPATTDPCGKVSFGRKRNLDEHLIVGRMDWQQSVKHSMFGRYEVGYLDQPSDYDGKNAISASEPDYYRHSKSFVLGDTYSISPNMVSSFRGTVLRTVNDKALKNDLFSFQDLGVKMPFYPQGIAKQTRLTVDGQFQADMSSEGFTNSTVYQLANDVSLVRGNHQLGFGAQHVHNMMNYTSATQAVGAFNFNGQFTGNSLGDLMLGRANTFTQSRITNQYYRQNFLALYLQDTWKANANLTVNAGVRWEPFFGPYDKAGPGAFFSRERFDQGLKSEIYPNAPAGVYFQGEGGIPKTNAFTRSTMKHFAPRVGLAWDPKGNGFMIVRAAYGIFYDAPHLHQFGGRRDTAPKGAQIVVNSPSFDDPWASHPGGNPFPIPLDKTSPFPLAGRYTVFPWEMKKPYINQWNLSIQKQFGANWLLAANYLGSNIIHMMYRWEENPAVFVPGVGDAGRNCFLNGVRVPYTVNPGAACSTTGNSNARRELNLANPAVGQYYSNIAYGDDGATRNYNAMVLQIQRRRANGITIQGNYTWSHSIDDGYQDVIQNTGEQIQERRRANRGNSELDRRHNFNMSTVYDMPQFSNNAARILASGWQISGIVRILSGSYLTILSGIDTALSGTTDRRPHQVLASPYAADKTTSQWFNPAAFVRPAPGEYGSMAGRNILGPGSVRIDMGLTRKFRVREKQTLEFRAEAFNLPNHFNPPNPETTITSQTFGKSLPVIGGAPLGFSAGQERIMQMALKYVF